MKKLVLITLFSAVVSFAGVDISIASKEELMTLSGIGDKKAEEIIKTRESNCFTKVDDLKNVKGIGDKIFESIKPNITASGKCAKASSSISPTTTPSSKAK